MSAVVETVLYQDQRALVTTHRVTIDGATMALAQVSGAQVFTRRKHGAGPWVVTALCLAGSFVIDRILLYIGAFFVLVSIGSLLDRESVVAVVTPGGLVPLGKGANAAWAQNLVGVITEVLVRR